MQSERKVKNGRQKKNSTEKDWTMQFAEKYFESTILNV